MAINLPFNLFHRHGTGPFILLVSILARVQKKMTDWRDGNSKWLHLIDKFENDGKLNFVWRLIGSWFCLYRLHYTNSYIYNTHGKTLFYSHTGLTKAAFFSFFKWHSQFSKRNKLHSLRNQLALDLSALSTAYSQSTLSKLKYHHLSWWEYYSQ